MELNPLPSFILETIDILASSAPDHVLAQSVFTPLIFESMQIFLIKKSISLKNTQYCNTCILHLYAVRS